MDEVGPQLLEADSGPITSNQLKTGQLTTGDQDVFTFDANAGDSFSLVLGATGGASFGPLMRVFRPDGSPASGFDRYAMYSGSIARIGLSTSEADAARACTASSPDTTTTPNFSKCATSLAARSSAEIAPPS